MKLFNAISISLTISMILTITTFESVDIDHYVFELSFEGYDTLFMIKDTSNIFDVVIPFILKHEGDRFVNDVSINEVSRMGITLRTYRQYYGKGDINSIRYITTHQATEIYNELFWEANNLDSIVNIGFDKTAIVLMDSGVNIGPNRANKFLQRVLGIKMSGRIDEATLHALRDTKMSDEYLSTQLIVKRKNFYSQLVTKDSVYAKYHRGWNNRLRDIKLFVEEIDET